jgi:hypothetical protein
MLLWLQHWITYRSCMSYRAQHRIRWETDYVVRHKCVHNVCWEVSDWAEEGHRKVARYTGVEDVKWIVLPRYLYQHLVFRAKDNISPVVCFRFRCNFVMINYWTLQPTLPAMESLSDPAEMILWQQKMWQVFFFLILIRHQAETPLHACKVLRHIRLTCESFKLVFTIIQVLNIGFMFQGIVKVLVLLSLRIEPL